jgi:hypothetical protein
MADRIESVQHDAIHTSVTAVKKIGVVATQFVGHERERYTRQTRLSTAPAGATFSERSLGKSVATWGVEIGIIALSPGRRVFRDPDSLHRTRAG